jgi:hypothetical protein
MSIGHRISNSLPDAIDLCLAGCYRDDSPMLRLTERLDELRSAGWTEEEVREVELLVLKRLVGLQAGLIRSARPDPDDTVID